MTKAEERASELHILMWDKDFYNGFIKGYETADRDATIDSNEDGLIADTIRYKNEKQGEQKPAMIQWKGNNLKEVIDFTGIYKDGFEKWFHNSWEEYEKYVHEHNNIFKIFNKDGSHIEVPVGAWIVKTPDGYNTASRYVFRQKPAWSEEDEKMLAEFLHKVEVCDLLTNREEVWITKKIKSLRPQSHWRPSNEQMQVLKRLMPLFIDPKLRNIMEQLINNLQKLREK